MVLCSISSLNNFRRKPSHYMAKNSVETLEAIVYVVATVNSKVDERIFREKQSLRKGTFTTLAKSRKTQ